MHKFGLTLALAAAVLVAGCGSPVATEPPQVERAPAATPTGEPIPLKLGVLNLLSHAPLFLARDAGYFSEQGLDVEFVSFGPNLTEMIPALVQGQLDVAATAIQVSTLSAIGQGSNIKFVADKGSYDPSAPCPADALVARKQLISSGTLDEPEGLRGLRVTPGTGTVAGLMLERALNEAGLTMEDMTPTEVRDISARVEALKAGSLDIAGLGEPWITRAVESGAAEVWMGYQHTFPNFSGGTLMYGPGMLRRDRDVGVRFMIAYLKGVDLFRQGKTDANVDAIASFTQLDPAEVRKLCWTSIRADGTIEAATLLEFQDWAVESGLLDAPLPIEQIYDPQYVEQASAVLGR